MFYSMREPSVASDSESYFTVYLVLVHGISAAAAMNNLLFQLPRTSIDSRLRHETFLP